MFGPWQAWRNVTWQRRYARCRGHFDAALPHDNDPSLASARAALALAQKIAEKNTDDGLRDEGTLNAAIAVMENHQARFDLALAHHGAGAL